MRLLPRMLCKTYHVSPITYHAVLFLLLPERFPFRNLRGVPAAAERPYERYRRGQALAEQADRRALVVQLGGLHDGDVEKAHRAGPVLVVREGDRFARRADRLVL